MRKQLVPACALVAALAGSTATAQIVLPLGQYGRLNQRAVNDPAGIAPGFGLWACGPTSVVNSFAYLENAFPMHYQRKLVPEIDGVPGVTWMDLQAVAQDLASAAYMDTRAPGAPDMTNPGTDNYEKDIHGIGPNQPGGSAAGGTLFTDFAWGKDAYLNRPGIPATQIDGASRDAYVPARPGRDKPAWLDDGAFIPGAFITQALDEQKDLEIGFTWQIGDTVPAMGNSDNLGGHFVTVYGWEFDLTMGDDANGNFMFDPGETITLRIIDPLGPMLPGGENMAPSLFASLYWRPDGELFIGYNGGAAGFGGGLGRLRIALSEIPSPASLGLFALGSLVGSRRRRVLHG